MIGLTNAFVVEIVAGGLACNVGKGTLWLNATLTKYTTETIVALTANATNYIFININTAQIQVNTTGYTVSTIPLATVVTSFKGILSLTDNRPDFFFISGGGAVPNYADDELPTGAVNGINFIYTLAHAPNPSASLQYYINGQLLDQGLDYTLTGNTLSMSYAPQTGDVPVAFYRY